MDRLYGEVGGRWVSAAFKKLSYIMQKKLKHEEMYHVFVTKIYLLLFGSDVLGKCALENKLGVLCLCWAVVFQNWPWRKQKQHHCRA